MNAISCSVSGCNLSITCMYLEIQKYVYQLSSTENTSYSRILNLKLDGVVGILRNIYLCIFVYAVVEERQRTTYTRRAPSRMHRTHNCKNTTLHSLTLNSVYSVSESEIGNKIKQYLQRIVKYITLLIVFAPVLNCHRYILAVFVT
ncbi:unnamed protein product [Chrysodeixis includens]|uniref:Uncharacterized protein n=1 Tax=Chrysodeixis includens TaxID=689277 RepID=A0A9P0FZ67_CHRIL|nr:unnamed protein product [Chrysodeixis includens]